MQLPRITVGLGKDRDYFVENLSMLASSGMPIMGALDAIEREVRSRRAKKIIAMVRSDIESGSPLWRTLAKTGLFPEHAVSLIRLGEESGKLTENLKVIAIEQEKNRIFKSKLRSAMMYPVFVLSLTAIIGVGIAWFILPKLALVFSQLKIKLPLITKILIGTGTFLGTYGQYAIPTGIAVMAVLFFFLFSFSKTKFIGQFLLFSAPGIKGLIKEVEIARFGYLLGTLLQAGLPVTHALGSLAAATEVSRYRKLYTHVRDRVEEGDSLQKSFASFKHINRLIPAPIQQLIVGGEKSGTLQETLLKVGQTFEAKSDTTTKNLTTVLEPILLVVVWLGVVAVALAVILPIYSLVGNLNQTTSPPEPPTEQSSVSEPASPAAEAATSSTEVTLSQLKILSTGLGYVNVRSGTSTANAIIAKALPGETYFFQNKSNGWYEIVLNGGTTTGWVAGRYVRLISTTTPQ